jgi:hypothetical protein
MGDKLWDEFLANAEKPLYGDLVGEGFYAFHASRLHRLYMAAGVVKKTNDVVGNSIINKLNQLGQTAFNSLTTDEQKLLVTEHKRVVDISTQRSATYEIQRQTEEQERKNLACKYVVFRGVPEQERTCGKPGTREYMKDNQGRCSQHRYK